MSYRSLRDFIAKLEAAGDLVRVTEQVSTVLEMTEIQTRLIAEGGPAVLFEHPVKADGTPSDIPVLVNLFGTVKRVAMGVTLGGNPRTTAAQLREVGEMLATLRKSAAVVRGSPPSVTPMATRFTVPNKLTSTGISLGVPSALTGCSNNTAGPPSAISRVWISVISRTVDTGSVTRTRSPAASSLAMKSRSER